MDYLTHQHRLAVVVCDGWNDYDVFSTLLDTLLSGYRRSNVELGTVPHGNHELVHRYAKEYNMSFATFPKEDQSILDFANEHVIFTEVDDEITKHMAQVAAERGHSVKTILVEPSENSS